MRCKFHLKKINMKANKKVVSLESIVQSLITSFQIEGITITLDEAKSILKELISEGKIPVIYL